jgi:tetratricopeptide (TPR) repeat protein
MESSDWRSKALEALSWIKRESGDFSGAKEAACESQRWAKIAGNLYVEASVLRGEALYWQSLGRYIHCLALLDRGTHLLDLSGTLGSSVHSSIKNSQAEVHRCKSEYVEARTIQTHILHDHSADKHPHAHALALVTIAQIDVEIGGAKHDVDWTLDRADALCQTIKYSDGLSWCHIIRAALDAQQGNLLAANHLFQNCLKSAWGRDAEGATYCLEKLCALEQWRPMDLISLHWTATFLVYSYKLKQRLELHKALQFFGNVFQTQGDLDTAISLFTVALDGFTQMDVHRSRGECMVQLGDISEMNGEDLMALEQWETARPLLERSSQSKQLAHLDAKIIRIRDASQS